MHKRTELLWHKTPDFTPDMRPPNRPDMNPVDYGIWTVIQECVYQKQQGTSNISDELWLLTERHISQGRVETPIRKGEQFCCSFVANLLRYVWAKNCQNIMRFDKVIAKIKGCIFLPHSVTDTRQAVTRQNLTLWEQTLTFLNTRFFPRTIRDWNSLPENIVTAPSVQSFKERLRLCHYQ